MSHQFDDATQSLKERPLPKSAECTIDEKTLKVPTSLLGGLEDSTIDFTRK